MTHELIVTYTIINIKEKRDSKETFRRGKPILTGDVG